MSDVTSMKPRSVALLVDSYSVNTCLVLTHEVVTRFAVEGRHEGLASLDPREMIKDAL